MLFAAMMAPLVPSIGMAGCHTGEQVDATDLQPALWALIEDAAGATRAELEDAPGAMTFSASDLNNDGFQEYCVALETSLTCSMGKAVCLHMVLQERPEPAVLIEDTSHELYLSPGEQNGWHNLVSLTHTADGLEITPVRFDGVAYQWTE